LRSLRRTAFCAPPVRDSLAQPNGLGRKPKDDSGLKGRDGWRRGVQPCSCPVADFQPAASATAKTQPLRAGLRNAGRPALERRDSGEALGGFPSNACRGKPSGRRGPAKNPFLRTQKVKEPGHITSLIPNVRARDKSQRATRSPAILLHASDKSILVKPRRATGIATTGTHEMARRPRGFKAGDPISKQSSKGHLARFFGCRIAIVNVR